MVDKIELMYSMIVCAYLVFKSVKKSDFRNIRFVLFVIEIINVENYVENYKNFLKTTLIILIY